MGQSDLPIGDAQEETFYANCKTRPTNFSSEIFPLPRGAFGAAGWIGGCKIPSVVLFLEFVSHSQGAALQ
ncbi:MAG: hypothetical protein LBH53_00315 [Puniceicoccales bacterium]|nr:hypothetical protein [Puniceicoccales bacterium]